MVTVPVPLRVTFPLSLNSVGLLLELSCREPLLIIVPCKMVVLLSFPLYVPELVSPLKVEMCAPGVSITP